MNLVNKQQLKVDFMGYLREIYFLGKTQTEDKRSKNIYSQYLTEIDFLNRHGHHIHLETLSLSHDMLFLVLGARTIHSSSSQLHHPPPSSQGLLPSNQQQQAHQVHI